MSEETHFDALNGKLDKILMNLDAEREWLKELSEDQKKILAMLSERSKLVVTQEIGTIEKQYHEQKDFTKCLVMKITAKSWLIKKDSLQMFLAFSNVKKINVGKLGVLPENITEMEFYDFTLTEKAETWVPSKWEKFKVVKNRQ